MGAKGRRTTNRRKVKTRKSWRNPYWSRPSVGWDGPKRLMFERHINRILIKVINRVACRVMFAMAEVGLSASEAGKSMRKLCHAMKETNDGKT